MGGLADLLNKEKGSSGEKSTTIIPDNEPIIISQSLAKHIIDKNQEPVPHCPLQIYECDIKRNFDFPTDSMEAGNFGEGLLLGESADGVKKELKRKNNGEMTIDEVRIRGQVQMANIKLLKHQINIIPHYNTQVPIAIRFEGCILQTKIDIFPTPIVIDDKQYIAIVDIKFSQDISTNFGPYQWRNGIAWMDHLQPDALFLMLDNLDIDLCKQMYPDFEKRVGYDNIFTPFILKWSNHIKFFYFVIGYKKVDIEDIIIIERMKHEIINGKATTTRQQETKERLRKVADTIKSYYEKGFIPIPYEDPKNFRGCSKCYVNIHNKKPGSYCKCAQEIISC